MYVNEDGKKKVELRIVEGNELLEREAIDRGYEKSDWQEIHSEFIVKKRLKYDIPNGYLMKDGEEGDYKKKAYAHMLAFGYEERGMLDIAERAFQSLYSAYDYRKDLDLLIMDKDKNVVSFCGFWYDEINEIGIIEPMGTVPKERKKGFGKALIYEGINRLMDMGAKKVYVGSDQDFYKRLGFEECSAHNNWKKIY